MHAGGYGLTPADGQAQRARSAGSRAGNVAWPVRSGLVPPLAEDFTTRPDTAPSLEAALVPGAAVVLVPGEDAGSALDWPGSSGKTQLAAHLADSLWQSREVDLLGWVAAGSRASILSGYLQLPRARWNAPGGRNAPPSAHPAPVSGCVQWRGGPEGGMRVHSGLPVPIPRPRRFRPRYRDVSRSAEIRGKSVLSEAGGLEMVATLTASWMATTDLGYRDRLAEVPP